MPFLFRLPSKTKTVKDSWHFNGSLLCKPDFFLAAKNLLSLLKTKNNDSSAKDKWKYSKSCFKVNARTCSKNSTTQGNIIISRLKKRLLVDMKKKKKIKPKIKPIIKIYKMNFTN